jgi:hypothetical protein
MGRKPYHTTTAARSSGLGHQPNQQSQGFDDQPTRQRDDTAKQHHDGSKRQNEERDGHAMEGLSGNSERGPCTMDERYGLSPGARWVGLGINQYADFGTRLRLKRAFLRLADSANGDRAAHTLH